MKLERRKEAITKLNEEIQKYFKTLQEVMILENDENYKPVNPAFSICKERTKQDRHKLISIIGDLTIISKSIEMNRKTAIIDIINDKVYMYEETKQALKNAGINWKIINDEKGKISFWID